MTDNVTVAATQRSDESPRSLAKSSLVSPTDLTPDSLVSDAVLTFDELLGALRLPFDDLEAFLTRWREALPEIWALKTLSEDPQGDLHKDNFTHTLKVMGQCGADATDTTLLAALFHDVGKPLTRHVQGGEVTFHGHEVVGARLIRKRFKDFGVDPEPVITTILCAARAQAYLDSWTDSSVRRIRVDAGSNWDDAIRLAHSDVTSRHAYVHRRVHQTVDSLTTRSDDLVIDDARKAERPSLNGNDLFELGVPRGPEMGRLLTWLLDENRAGRLTDPDDARRAIRSQLS